MLYYLILVLKVLDTRIVDSSNKVCQGPCVKGSNELGVGSKCYAGLAPWNILNICTVQGDVIGRGWLTAFNDGVNSVLC